jgi:DNA processing protein
MSSAPNKVGAYAAAVQLCRSSTTKRRILDSLVQRAGLDAGVREFIQRQSILEVHFREMAEHLASAWSGQLASQVLSVHDPGYPPLLKSIPSPPAMLFVRGNLGFLSRRAVAVVGSRTASDAGVRMAAAVARDLAKVGIVVVSGLARGIDAAAHRAALEVGGVTVAVLGTPIDRTYPADHKSLQEEIAQRGALVSQFPPGLPISRFNFPERNRVMAGICLATVVVEAGDTSGAVIQARQCLSQGRTLFLTDLIRKNTAHRWAASYLARGALVANSAAEILKHLDEQ